VRNNDGLPNRRFPRIPVTEATAYRPRTPPPCVDKTETGSGCTDFRATCVKERVDILANTSSSKAIPSALNHARPLIEFFGKYDVELPKGEVWDKVLAATTMGKSMQQGAVARRLPERTAANWLAAMVNGPDCWKAPGLPTGNADHFIALIDKFPQIRQTELLQLLLPTAAANGHTNIVAAIIGHGILVDQADVLGNTPLLQAIRGGHEETVDCLLRLGANVEAPDRYGRTPMYEAAKTGNIKLLEFLITSGADLGMNREGSVVPFLVALENRAIA
jgi:hypothetical protein